MRTVYAPGCALMLYKPELARKVLEVLRAELGAQVSSPDGKALVAAGRKGERRVHR